jgi:uncharacterized protein
MPTQEDSQWHPQPTAIILELAEGRLPWAVPWPCVHEFFAISTHPRIYSPATPLSTAIDQVHAWFESPSLVLLAESGRYWQVLSRILEASKITGPQVHDARIAGLCLVHGISELWTSDRDFSRFQDVKIRNPLLF